VTTLRVGIPLVALLVLFCLVDLRRNNDVRDFRPVLAMTTTGTPPSQPAEATKKPAPPILKELEKLIESADYQLARRKILEMDDRDRLSPEVAAIASTAELMLDPERLRTEKFESPVAVRALGTVIQRSPDWKNRYSAVRSLEKISDPGKLPILVYALEQDPDWAVRSEAAMALRGETEEKIVLALENSAQFDPELLVRLSARQALARPAPGQPR
jgi:HEAT repeat protein